MPDADWQPNSIADYWPGDVAMSLIYQRIAAVCGTLAYMSPNGNLPFFPLTPEKGPEAFPWGFLDEKVAGVFRPHSWPTVSSIGYKSLRQENLLTVQANFIMAARSEDLGQSTARSIDWPQAIAASFADNNKLGGIVNSIYCADAHWTGIAYQRSNFVGVQATLLAELFLTLRSRI